MFPYVWADSFSSKHDFISYIHSLPQQTLIYASQSLASRSVIENEFPFLEEQDDYFTGSIFIFSKDSLNGRRPLRHFTSLNNFDDDKKQNWSTIFPEYLSDKIYCSPFTSYKITNKMEWGPVFSLPVKELISCSTDWLDISVNVFSPDSLSPDVILVANLKSANNQVYWNGSDLRDYWIHPGWNKIFLSLKISDLPLKMDDLVFNTFLWNKGLAKLYIDDYEVAVKKGNPLVYGLYYKIE